MSRFQRPLVARTDSLGEATLYNNSASVVGEHTDAYKLVLTDMRLRVVTPAIDVTEENHARTGAVLTNAAGGGLAANVHGSSTEDVANYASSGYVQGSVMLRGNIPIGKAIGLTTTKFYTADTDGYEKATKVFEVVARLAKSDTGENAWHWVRFKMFFEGIDIEWSQRALNVNVTIKGRLTGLLSSFSSGEDLHNFSENIGDAHTG
jgi:hypothetical protein